MENTKAYNILKTFSPKELIEFSKFLNSSYFNESRNVTKLFDLIRHYHPDFSSVHLTSAELHKKIFGNEIPRVNNSVNNLFTKLIKKAELYLSVKELRNDVIASDYYLMKRYYTHDSRILFDHKLNKFYSGFIESSTFNPEYSFMAYLSKVHELEYLAKDLYSGKKVASPLLFSSNSRILCLNFYASIFRDYLKFLMVMAISRGNESVIREDRIYRKIIDNVPEDLYDFAILRIYRKFVNIYSLNQKYDFSEILKELQSKELSGFREDVSYLSKILILYGKLLHNRGTANSGKYLMNLLEYISKEKLWLDKSGKISEHAFNYAVRISSELGEFHWSEKFINDHSQNLDSDDAQNVLNYNLAVFFFFKTKKEVPYFPEDFELSLSYLSKVKIHFFLKKLGVYRLMMMIYYESGQTDYVEYQYDNLVHYLKEHKHTINDLIYQQNLNFAQFVYRLLKLGESGNAEKIDLCFVDFKAADHIEERNWIMEKIMKLMGESG